MNFSETAKFKSRHNLISVSKVLVNSTRGQAAMATFKFVKREVHSSESS